MKIETTYDIGQMVYVAKSYYQGDMHIAHLPITAIYINKAFLTAITYVVDITYIVDGKYPEKDIHLTVEDCAEEMKQGILRKKIETLPDQ